jgi:YD repeat-containing protein
VSPILVAWSVTGQQAFPGPSISGEIGQADVTAPAAACTNTTGNPTVGGWISVNLDPSAFSNSPFPGLPNAQNGLALSSSLTDDNQWKEFDSFNTPNAPYLSLTYTPQATPQISAQYPPNNYNSPSPSPVLIATGTEAAGVTNPLKYDFTVYDAAGGQHLGLHHLEPVGRAVVPTTGPPTARSRRSRISPPLATETDPAGNVTDYAYDAEGQLLTVTLQNYTGNPAQPTSPAPLLTESRAYDPAGRLASVTRSNPSPGASYVEQASTYDPAGNLISQATNNGATTTNYTVDADSRTAAQTLDPAGLDRTTSYAYTADSYLASQTLTGAGSSTPVRSVSYGYDPMGNMTSQSQTLQGGGNTPTAWWPLNQTSGTTVPDASGTGHPATANGVTWSGGAENGGVVSTAGPVLDTTGSFTVSAWVDPANDLKTTQTAVSQNGQPYAPDSSNPGAVSNSAFTLGFTGSLGLGVPTANWSFGRPLTSANSSSSVAATSTATATFGSWTHLVGVYDVSTGTMTLYVNGVASGTATDTTPAASTGPLEIGEAETATSGYTKQLPGRGLRCAGVPAGADLYPGDRPVQPGPAGRRQPGEQADHLVDAGPARAAHLDDRPGQQHHLLLLRPGGPAGGDHGPGDHHAGLRRLRHLLRAGHDDRLRHLRRADRVLGRELQRDRDGLRRRRQPRVRDQPVLHPAGRGAHRRGVQGRLQQAERTHLGNRPAD